MSTSATSTVLRQIDKLRLRKEKSRPFRTSDPCDGEIISFATFKSDIETHFELNEYIMNIMKINNNNLFGTTHLNTAKATLIQAIDADNLQDYDLCFDVSLKASLKKILINLQN